MIVKIKMFLQKVIMKEALEIPSEFKGELLHELLWLNIKRERMLSYFLIVTVVALLCLDSFSSRLWTKDVHIFVSFSCFHVMLLAISIFFLIVYNSKMLLGTTLNYSDLFHIFYIWLIMLLCSIIGIITISVHKQPYAYFFAMFSIASMVLLSKR